jgi:radical SAM superfamily enzyme YgiQ (UPF0313 family)
MKVLLTTLNAKFVHTSLALRTIRAYCRHIPGVDLRIEEYTINEHVDDICAEIFKQSPDVAGFSCYIWNISQTLAVVNRLKKVAPNIKILLGGPEVTYDAGKILSNNNVDYIIQGEGEQNFYEFLRFNSGEISADRVPGLCYRDDGEIKTSQPGSLISNLDEIPFAYDENELAVLKKRIIYYESSRGCPFNCSYCLSSTTKGVRFYSLKRVKQDLSSFINEGVNQIKFVDRTFNCNPRRTMEIWDFIKKTAKPGTNFHFEICADLLTDEMLDFLENVPIGLFQFEIGVQTTHRPTMDIIRRRTDFDKLAFAVKKIGEHRNIHRHLDLIAGLPKEPFDKFKKSFNDVYLLKPEKLQLGFLKLLKGSDIRKHADLYQYKFTHEPPYEVLENEDLPYSDLLTLKMIERLVELYHNSHKFENTLKFLLAKFFSSPFDFYSAFAQYWYENNLHRVSHSLESLYCLLFDFCKRDGIADVKVLANLMKFDFILNNRYGKVPEVIEKQVGVKLGSEFKQACFDFLKDEENVKHFIPQYEHLPSKEIYKRVRFEVFTYDCLSGMGFGNFTVLFAYDTSPKIIPMADAFLIDV